MRIGLGGSFGVVYKAIERSTGQFVAIKHVSPELHYLSAFNFVLTVLLDRSRR